MRLPPPPGGSRDALRRSSESTVRAGMPGATRRASPVRTAPGPTSTSAWAPISTIRRTEDSHCTGDPICRRIRSRRVSTSATGPAPTLVTTGTRGARRGAASTTTAKAAAASAMSGEWKAPLTLSGTTRRAPAARARAPAAATASSVPLMTTWPGALRFATTTVPSTNSQSRASSAASRPRTAAIVPRVIAAMRRLRSMTSRRASSGASAPAATQAVNSPTEWPATATTSSADGRAAARTISVSTSAGWAISVRRSDTSSSPPHAEARLTPLATATARSRPPSSFRSRPAAIPGVWLP